MVPATPTTRPPVTDQQRRTVLDGRGVLGIELGSSRIKAVLIGPDHQTLVSGTSSWENQLVDGLWTFSLDAVWRGVRECFRALDDDVVRLTGEHLGRVAGLGVSAMMHGYLVFDADGEQLVPFRTWRNTNTGTAAVRLSAALGQNMPHRWSATHLYQAVLDGEEHVPRVAYLTTLAGYVHWQLSGEKVLGVGDASGMFPVDPATGTFDAALVQTFDRLTAEAGASVDLHAILPTVRRAGQSAGELTAAGALLLDPTGRLDSEVPMCPPEGDAGTGMVATNSVAPRTGNVSAGTSIFAMVVLEHPLRGAHHELDLVATPAGDPVAMVHCNNGASELDAWVGLFVEFARLLGSETSTTAVFETLFSAARRGRPDCGGMLAYNYLAGEPITGLEQGRPLFFRTPGSPLDLATFVRTHLFSALATLRIGMDILQQDEGVSLDAIFAHGGLFKTAGVVQGLLAAALDTPVTVGDGAAEGGAWGIAILAAYAAGAADRSLTDFLAEDVFAGAPLTTLAPDPDEVHAFAAFTRRYQAALPVQVAAVRCS